MSRDADADRIEQVLSSVVASSQTTELLRGLHAKALAEPAYVSIDDQAAYTALDKFVALDPEKCALVYLLLRASRATNIVEAGTSFGVSTIYLALAAKQNAALLDCRANVIGTENEPTKADVARKNWGKSDEDLTSIIDLRLGDIRQTLQDDLPDRIDFLLLDIWCYLALPAVKLVKPHMRPGATIVADNTDKARVGYADLLTYLDDPSNGFRTTTAPYDGGLLIATFVG